MRKFMVPVTYCVSGHVMVDAETPEAAAKLVEKLVASSEQIDDPTFSLDIHRDEIAEDGQEEEYEDFAVEPGRCNE